VDQFLLAAHALLLVLVGHLGLEDPETNRNGYHFKERKKETNKE
jgi:hypothetical protein